MHGPQLRLFSDRDSRGSRIFELFQLRGNKQRHVCKYLDQYIGAMPIHFNSDYTADHYENPRHFHYGRYLNDYIQHFYPHVGRNEG